VAKRTYKKRYRPPPILPGVPIENLNLTSCRYIIDTPKYVGTFYCGHTIDRGSYCKTHANLCYRKELYAEELGSVNIPKNI
jgi:hypothetical protein